jgi:hypothetical protein
MSKPMLCGLTVATVLSLGILTLALHAQGQPAKEPQAPAFTGKVILVEAGPGVAATLEKPELRVAGGRTFVTGTAVQDSTLTKEHFPGARVWIPLEDVKRLVELEDLEKLKKRPDGK